MRIRTVFLIGIITVAIPGLVASSWLALDDWSRWERATNAVGATRVVSNVQRAQTAFAVETGHIIAAALVATPDLSVLRAASQVSDIALEAARRSASLAGFDAQPAADIAVALSKLRQELDVLVAKPVLERSPAFVQKVLVQRQQLGARLLGLGNVAAVLVAKEDPSIGAVVNVATQVMDMRDYAGRRSLLINNWLGHQPVTQEQITTSDQFTGRVQQAWENAQRMIDTLPGAPGLKQERVRLTETFEHRDEPRWRDLIDTARAHVAVKPDVATGAWPYDLAGFRAWGIPAQASIVDLRDAALNEALTDGAAIADAARRQVAIAVALVLVTLTVSGGSIVILLRRVVSPLQKMTGSMARIAANDLLVAIPGLGRSDEIGAMAQAIQVLKNNALHTRAMEQEQEIARQGRAAEDERVRAAAASAAAAEAATLVVGSIGTGLERLAAGDLTFRVEAVLPTAYEKLRGDLNAAMAELQELVRNIITNSAGLRSGTGEIAQASDDLSKRTENQAASLEETAAALDQITATVRKMADGAKQAHAIVSKTKTDAAQSGEVVRRAVSAMDGIEQSSQEISQIVGLIDEIAFQTNLLALNAGVEAARAGEAGRGFAVVASEVRALAQRSAGAAKEIKTLITRSGQQVGEGVKLVGQTGAALERIVTQVDEITVVVSEIAASAQEQATGLQQVNTAINQMDQVTQQNAAMVEQTTAASHALAHDTTELVNLTKRFQVGPMARPAHEPAKLPRRAAKPAPRAAFAPVQVVKQAARARPGALAKTDSWEEF